MDVEKERRYIVTVKILNEWLSSHISGTTKPTKILLHDDDYEWLRSMMIGYDDRVLFRGIEAEAGGKDMTVPEAIF